MEDLTVGVYAKDAIFLRVPKTQIKIVGEGPTQKAKLPALCLVNDSLLGVATEWVEDEGVYIVDWDDRKIFTYNNVDAGHKPEKVGCQLYLKNDEITTEKGSNKPLGYFLGMKGDTVLFKLL